MNYAIVTITFKTNKKKIRIARCKNSNSEEKKAELCCKLRIPLTKQNLND